MKILSYSYVNFDYFDIMFITTPMIPLLYRKVGKRLPTRPVVGLLWPQPYGRGGGRNFIQKSSSNALHHGNLQRVHTDSFCCRMRTTLYTLVCRPQEFFINLSIFELKTVSKIFSKRTKLFFVDCQIFKYVLYWSKIFENLEFLVVSHLVDDVIVSLWQYCHIHMTLLSQICHIYMTMMSYS